MSAEILIAIAVALLSLAGAIATAVWAVGAIRGDLQAIKARVNILEDYKKVSESSKDGALQALARIEGLLVGIQSDIKEVKKEYHDLRKDFDSHKDNIRKN